MWVESGNKLSVKEDDVQNTDLDLGGRLTARRHRRSIRLRGYDYSDAGAYFVTICAKDRACLFGEVVDREMRLNPIGQIVDNEWRLSATLRDEIEMDEWVVMPNHLHGIVCIDTACRGDRPFAPTTCGPKPRSLGSFIAGFKSAATKQINSLRGTPGVPVWQRNYYEHVIRNEDSLDRIRRYIAENPLRWAYDRENPAAVSVAAPMVKGDDPRAARGKRPTEEMVKKVEHESPLAETASVPKSADDAGTKAEKKKDVKKSEKKGHEKAGAEEKGAVNPY